MCQFELNEWVRLKKTEERGEIIGFFSGDFTIILFDIPRSSGERGKVVHAMDLEKIVDRRSGTEL